MDFKTVKTFFNNLCPSYSEAGDLGNYATLAMYSMSVNDAMASFVVSFMLFGYAFNAASQVPLYLSFGGGVKPVVSPTAASEVSSKQGKPTKRSPSKAPKKKNIFTK